MRLTKDFGESRMREIRTSGSTRGRESGGHWRHASHPVLSLSTLVQSLSPPGRGLLLVRAGDDDGDMRKRRLWLGLIAVFVLAAGFVVLFRGEREPEYGGKRLSEWVKVLPSSWDARQDPDVKEAEE